MYVGMQVHAEAARVATVQSGLPHAFYSARCAGVARADSRRERPLVVVRNFGSVRFHCGQAFPFAFPYVAIRGEGATRSDKPFAATALRGA
jgi:hypothetical protein